MPETVTPQPLISPVPPITPVMPVTNQTAGHSQLFRLLVTITVILLISGLALGVYQLGKSHVSSPTTEPPTVSPASPVANWETYTDDEVGFTFKYPVDRYVQQSPRKDGKFITIESGDPLELISIYMSNDQTIVSDFGRKNSNGGPLSNLERVQIDSRDGIKYWAKVNTETNQAAAVTIQVIKDQYSIELVYFQVNGQSDKTFNQILATFKFLDQRDETAGWESYRNEKYGFGFNYPSGWGDVQEKTMTYGPNEYERGESYVLTFSGNHKARGGGVSSDFTRPMSGNDETFSGNSQKPKNVGSSIYVSLPGCEERYLQAYNGWVEFNLPGKEISGFRLILPILSQTEIQKFSLLYPIFGDGSCPMGSKELEQAQQHAGDILKKIETGDIDKESRENLQIFKDVLKSAYVF